jgi:hypothetical protein
MCRELATSLEASYSAYTATNTGSLTPRTIWFENLQMPSCWGMAELDKFQTMDMAWYREQNEVMRNETQKKEALNNDELERHDSRGYCSLFMKQEVIMIYWPPNLTSRDICASNGYTAVTLPSNPSHPSVVTMDAITFSGEHFYVKEAYYTEGAGRMASANMASHIGTSVLSGPFIFTSPTVYLVHHTIHGVQLGKNSQRRFQVRPAGTIAIHTDQVYSIVTNEVPSEAVEFANSVATGKWDEDLEHEFSSHKRIKTVQFDFGHLEAPVPAVQYYMARNDCLKSQTHCGTVTDDNYRPRVWVNDTAWISSILPNLPRERNGCKQWVSINGPPIAFRPAYTTSVDSPEIFQTSAQPSKATATKLGTQSGLEKISSKIQAQPGGKGFTTPGPTPTKAPQKPSWPPEMNDGL